MRVNCLNYNLKHEVVNMNIRSIISFGYRCPASLGLCGVDDLDVKFVFNFNCSVNVVKYPPLEILETFLPPLNTLNETYKKKDNFGAKYPNSK